MRALSLLTTVWFVLSCVQLCQCSWDHSKNLKIPPQTSSTPPSTPPKNKKDPLVEITEPVPLEGTVTPGDIQQNANLDYSHGGFPIDSGESVDTDSACVFHANRDVSIFYSSGGSLDQTNPPPRSQIETMAKFTFEGGSWTHLTDTGFRTSGFPKDITQTEWKLSTRAYVADDQTHTIYGLQGQVARDPAAYAVDDHGFFWGVKLIDEYPFQYYHYDHYVSSTSHNMATWNASFPGNHADGKWSIQGDMALFAAPWICCSAIPDRFSIFISRLMSPEQPGTDRKWQWYNTINLRWENAKPADFYNELEVIRTVSGGVRYVDPSVIAVPGGFWIVLRSKIPNSLETQIHLLRYRNETQQIERLTATGWALSGQLWAVNGNLNVDSIVEPLPYAAAAAGNGDLQIFYYSKVGNTRFLRTSRIRFDGGVESEAVLRSRQSLPLEDPPQLMAESFPDSGNPFVLITSPANGSIMGHEWDGVHWTPLETGTELMRLRTTQAKLKCLKGYSERKIMLIANETNRLYAIQTQNELGIAPLNPKPDPRPTTPQAAPADLWAYNGENVYPTSNFSTVGHFSVNSMGEMAYSIPIVNQLYFLPETMNTSHENVLQDWQNLKFPLSVVQSPLGDLLYVLTLEVFQGATIKAFNPRTIPMQVHPGLSMVDGVPLSYSGQMAIHGSTLVVADGRNARVARVAFNGSTLASAGAFGVRGVQSGQFQHPSGICVLDVNGESRIYVSDLVRQTISQFDSSGNFSGIEWGGVGSSNGKFHEPSSLSCHGDSVYVVDRGNNRVQVFSSTGEFRYAFNQLPGTGSPRVDRVTALSVDPSGSLYFVGREAIFPNRHRIYKMR